MNAQGERWIIGGNVMRRLNGHWSLQEMDVRIENTKIAELLPPNSRSGGPNDVDARNKIIIPGLINAHLHSNDNFLRGMVDNLPLELYMLVGGPVTGIAPLSPSMLKARTLLGGLECLLTGTTSIIDDCHYFPRITPEGIDAVMGAYDELGIRALVTANLSDRPMPDTVPYVKEFLETNLAFEIDKAFSFDIKDVLGICEDSLRRYNNQGKNARVTFAMAASGPQRCTSELLQRIWEIAHRWQVPVVTHVVETRVQAITGKIFYGMTLFEYLDKLGCLDERTLIVHGIWVKPSDIDLLSHRRSTVLHNPTSNLRLGSGVAPIRELLDAGINVALGTDGISTNDAQNMFLEMRLAGCLHKPFTNDYHKWVGAKEAFEMATLGGAVASCQQKLLGEIEPGYKADLVILDNNSTTFTPLYNPVVNIVFSEYGQSVRTVIVDGEIIVKDGQHTRLDLKNILDEAREQARKFFSDNAEGYSRLNEFMPAFEKAYSKAQLHAWNPSRYIYGDEG